MTLPAFKARADFQGGAANLYLPIIAGIDDLKLWPQLPLYHCELKQYQRQLVYQPQLILGFQVTLMADIRQEELLTVIVDPETEEVRIGQIPSGLQGLPKGFRPLPDRRRRPRKFQNSNLELTQHLGSMDWLKATDYQVYRLYQQACRFLQNYLAEYFASTEEEQRQKLAQEQDRLNKYYQGLVEETMANLYLLARKAAVLQVRVALAKRQETAQVFQNQLDEVYFQLNAERLTCQEVCSRLAVEQGKRLYELIQKYQPKIIITLISAARVYLPRARCTWLYQTPNTQGSLTLVYDHHAQRWLGLTCDICSQEIKAGVIGVGGSLLCLSSAYRCDVCSGYSEKPLQICSSCGQHYCASCGSSCLAAPGLPSCSFCISCAKLFCSLCYSLLSYGWIEGNMPLNA